MSYHKTEIIPKLSNGRQDTLLSAKHPEKYCDNFIIIGTFVINKIILN